MRGTIHQLTASRGGVPKRPLDRADVGERGITVDSQADKRHHGSPDQALCLYALEMIETLQAEGHPIYPGSTGENVTLRGLPWDDVRPGMRLRLGRDCLIEITDYASPCKTRRQPHQPPSPPGGQPPLRQGHRDRRARAG
jgi:MOSC domain-containing protein YiiM